MGVDSIKQKAAPNVSKTVAAKATESAKPEAVVAKKADPGFEVLKKKLMSISGRYSASPTEDAHRADLKDLISAQRSAVQAGGAAASRAPSTKALADVPLTSADDKGAAPGPRPESSDFKANRKNAAPTKQQVAAMKDKGYAETSSGLAVESLKTKAKAPPISGKDMMNAIVRATGDHDSHAASSEFKDLKAFVEPHLKDKPPTLSPEAIAAYKTYKAAVAESQNEKLPGIPTARYEAMVGKMENDLARATLEKDFGVKVKDGVKAGIFVDSNDPDRVKEWSTEELSRMHESFSQMPKADQARLKGLDLVRDEKAPPEAQREFAGGTIAGEYQPNTHTTDGVRDAVGSITMYDAAFPSDAADSRQASMHVIIHEAGHAVEGHARDDAQAKWSAANDKQSAQNSKVNAAIREENAAIGSRKHPPLDSVNGRQRAFGSAGGAAGHTFRVKQEAVGDAIARLHEARPGQTPDEVKAAQQALTKAKAARDVALGALAGTKAEGKAQEWVGATEKWEAATQTYTTENAKLAPLKADSAARLKEFENYGTTVNKTVGTETFKIPGPNSKEINDYLTARDAPERRGGKHHREKAVSTYGGKSTQEGYAEAYALYQRDPKYMKDHFPKQYGYFHEKHKNAADPA